MLVIVIFLLYLILIIALWNLVKITFKKRRKIKNLGKR